MDVSSLDMAPDLALGVHHTEGSDWERPKPFDLEWDSVKGKTAIWQYFQMAQMLYNWDVGPQQNRADRSAAVQGVVSIIGVNIHECHACDLQMLCGLPR